MLGSGALHSGGIGHAPMGGHRISGPDRAGFAGGLVANREDEIHHRRAGTGEFMPALAAQPVCRQMKPFERIQG